MPRSMSQWGIPQPEEESLPGGLSLNEYQAFWDTVAKVVMYTFNPRTGREDRTPELIVAFQTGTSKLLWLRKLNENQILG